MPKFHFHGPFIRFGAGHIYNNNYNEVTDGINTRDGAQVLVEGNVFIGSFKPLYSDSGYAVASETISALETIMRHLLVRSRRRRILILRLFQQGEGCCCGRGGKHFELLILRSFFGEVFW
jgi:hypothetical protein